MFFSKNSPYACQRTREQTQANAGADASESGGRDERVWEQMRPRLPPDSLTGIGSRRKDMGAQEANCNAERMASALESRALKIQRKSSLAVAPSQRKFALRQHNHLLRRQHCSSLCSQSEGHEHVANMTNALGHNFVGFSARAWPPQYSPPSLCEQSEGHEHVANMTNALGHNFVGFSARAWPPQYSPPSLCEQSELQCFAPGLRRTLLFSKSAVFFENLNTLPFRGAVASLPTFWGSGF